MPPPERPVDPRDAELERLNRLKDDFLVTLSHELRTPMTVVLGWARTLRAGGFDQPFARQAIEAIERNAERQLVLINQVLDVSDIVQGRLRLEIDAVDLLPLVSDVVEAVRPAAFARQTEIAWAPVSERVVIAGDAGRLRQVVWHLVSNAVRFTPVGGRVVVRVTRDDNRVRIQVSDNGIGIAKDFLPHVFEQFRQADASIRREHGGLGLGLAIVRHVVSLHGGEVTAASRGPGCGSTFVVTLPIRAAVAAPSARAAAASEVVEERRASQAVEPSREPEGPGGGGLERRLEQLGVLVVDPDGRAGELVEAILAGSGAQVRRAATAAEALAHCAAARQPDVIVIDVGSDEAAGYDLLRDLRTQPAARGARIPAIALTSRGTAAAADRAMAAGFQVHVAKPVFPGHLIDAVATLAGREVWS